MAYQRPPKAGTIPGPVTVKSPNSLNRMYDVIRSGINTGDPGGYYTAADFCQNRLFIWGHNPSGILGAGYGAQHPQPNSALLPLQVPGSNWATVTMAQRTAGATKADGTAWTWGASSYGNWQWQSYGAGGWGGTSNQSSPVQLPGNNWAKLYGGKYEMMAIKCDSTLWGWGGNAYGNLGMGAKGNCNAYYSPTQVPGNTWKHVSTNQYHGLGIKCDGTLWMWGNNTHGRLGFCCVVCPYPGTCCSPACYCPSVWACNNGWVPCCSLNTCICPCFSLPTQIPGNNWVKGQAFDNHTIAIKSDGTLWGWGHNPDGRMGAPVKQDYLCPIQLCGTGWVDIGGGIYSAIARKSDNTLWSWGVNPHGNLGQGDFTTRCSPMQIGAGSDWVKISCGQGGHHHAAIKSDGSLYTWGYNPHGELGCGGTGCVNSPIQVGAATSTYWRDIATGHHNTLAIACVPSNYSL